MRCSVIIPTRGAWGGADGPVWRCVASVVGQLGDGDEVIVSVDGGEPGRGIDDPRVRVIQGPQGGPGAARNRGLAVAAGDLVLFLNDDVVAGAGLIEAHRAAHVDRRSRGLGPAMVLGAAPWGVGHDDRVIDRLVRETSWIFFYDRMRDRDADRDWGFRHAWTLNLSVERAIAGRFDERLAQPMFDDLEWAWRVTEASGVPVVHRPGAAVTHEHRYTARGLLRREALLGHQAAWLHRVNPACARATFGVRFSPDEAALDGIRGVRAVLPGLLSGACEEFGAFEVFVGRRAASVGSDGQLAGVFESCRGWREAARLIGCVAFADGRDAAWAMEAADAAIACGIAVRVEGAA